MSFSRRYFLKSTGVALATFAAEPSFLMRTALAQSSRARTGRFSSRSSSAARRMACRWSRPSGIAVTTRLRSADCDTRASRRETLKPQSTSTASSVFIPRLRSLKSIYDEGNSRSSTPWDRPVIRVRTLMLRTTWKPGSPDLKSTRDGWLNRYLQARTDSSSIPFRAVAFSPNMPRSLMGKAPALAHAAY